MQTKLFATLAALLAAATLAPAASSGTDTVTILFSADGAKATFWGYADTQATCAVTVPAGADGSAVLDEALATSCITEWGYTEYSGGHFLQSINGVEGKSLDPVCITVCGYWELSVNGASVSYGLDAYHAAEGDAFGATYKNVNAWLMVELP